MEKETLDKFSAFIDENKGKRKFTQSLELSMNFANIDFNKQDNRLNLDIKLPNGKGKASNVIVFADDKVMSDKASQSGAKIIQSKELPTLVTDKVKLNELLSCDLLAQPSLMPQIAKSLGQFLGPRGKMPKPVIGADVSTLISNANKSITLKNKGKYLPTINCMVGTEKMSAVELAANIDEVLSSVSKKVGKQNLKSVYVKMTMSKPLRII
jgi:large subunit ribosomal protein L1